MVETNMDEKELEVLGNDENYWWFKAKNEIIKSFVKNKKKVINLACGTCYYNYAFNYNGHLDVLPINSESYDVAILADVIEHLPEELRFTCLTETKRILKKGGKLIITVPAHQWLYNSHDEFLEHELRYSKSKLADDLVKAGFTIDSLRYWNGTFFFPLVIWKKLVNKTGSDFRKLPKWLNYLFYKLIKIEEKIKYPFGITIIGEFRK